VLDVLAGHADVVGDLVKLIALFGAGQHAGAAQAVGGVLLALRRVKIEVFTVATDRLQPA
jgi:hypothetical protein